MELEFVVIVDLLVMIPVLIDAYDLIFGLICFWRQYQPRIGVRLNELMEGMVSLWESLT